MSLTRWIAHLTHLDRIGQLPPPPDTGAVAVPAISPAPPDNPYVNDMRDNVNGFVTLEAAEHYRTLAQTQGNAKQKAWSQLLPHKFAIGAARYTTELNLSDADKISNSWNCYFARTFWQFSPGTETKTWCPQAFIATPGAPGHLYTQGPTLPGFGSFSEMVTPADLDALFSAAYAFAATWPPG